jgi:hypothetical protein
MVPVLGVLPVTLVWLWKTGVLPPILSRFLPFLKRGGGTTG